MAETLKSIKTANNSFTLYSISNDAVIRIIKAVKNNYIMTGSFPEGCFKKGCFARFRSHSNFRDKPFAFTHSVYPDFMEKFVDDWNEKFNAVKLHIVHKAMYPFKADNTYGSNVYRVQSSVQDVEFYLPGYVFLTELNKNLLDFSVPLSYLAHHVIRILCYGESGMPRLLRKLGEDYNSFNSKYDEWGLIQTIIEANRTSYNPKRFYDGILTEEKLYKIFTEDVWLNKIAKASYAGQTTIIGNVLRTVSAKKTIYYTRGKYYIKGRSKFNGTMSCVNSDLLKGVLLDKASRHISKIKVISHRNSRYINKVLYVRDRALIPHNSEDVKLEYPYSYQIKE
jgi:hypothetical protein